MGRAMFRAAVILALATLSATALLTASAQENDLAAPAIQAYGLDLVPYATVRRDDGTYRRMLIASDVLPSVVPDAPLPDGTRILMETYYRPDQVGTVFHKRKIRGKWQYGSFSGARPDLTVQPRASCLACHAGAARTDFTFTLPSIRAVAAGNAPSDFTCDRGGRSPCGADTYRGGAAR